MLMRLTRPAVSLLIVMTVLLGLLYPLVVTLVAKAAFRSEADGSLVYRDGKLVGSTLIGQSFSDPKHFWGRPSATTPQPYNALGSSGSNLGPLNPALLKQVEDNVKALRAADPGNRRPVPVDLVTASASGLDPHITPAAAYYQAARVARARSLPLEQVNALIAAHEEAALLGVLGERRVNVLELNLALDRLQH
jgi:K+-transporting ATPase ATPase C chain